MIQKRYVGFDLLPMLNDIRQTIINDPSGRVNKSTGKRKELGAQHTIPRTDVYLPLLEEIQNIGSLYFEKFNITDVWSNVCYTGGKNNKHIHIGSSISGCFYLYVPEGSGEIEFSSGEKFLPKPGEIYWWNSDKEHWVHPNMSNETRISIAFNICPFSSVGRASH